MLSGVIGQSYNYDVNAADPNPGETDLLRFSLDSASLARGMIIHPTTGIITWSSPTLGVHPVTVTVVDPDNATDLQSYELNISDPNNNRPPQITSNVSGQIQVGSLFVHQVAATDPDGDSLAYSLTASPTGMSIDSAGLIRWTPSSAQLGSQSFTVQVSDGRTAGTVTKTFQVTVVTEPSNNPPAFTTTPKTALVVGNPYVYDANASDPDGDTLTFSLVTSPSGMTIDANTGVVRWTPTSSQVGTHAMTVRVADPRGGSAEQSANLNVIATNRQPVISSQPSTQAVKDKPYAYAVEASDPDGHKLTFSLGAATNASGGGLAIDANTGLLSWNPHTAGVFRIQINVVDELGMGVSQIYDVNVALTPPNNAPRITTTPALEAEVNTLYTYDANATDPDGDTVTFRLVEPATLPPNMSFNTASGVLTWTPSNAQLNQLVPFKVEASDGSLTATQNFSVRVQPQNVAPVVEAIPNRTVTRGSTYRYDVKATDANGDPLSYSLDPASVSAGIKIDASNGRITWDTSSSTPIANYPVTVTVSDDRLSATRSFQLTVVADTAGPTVSITTTATAPRVGDEIVLKVLAIDDVGVESKTLVLTSVTRSGSTTTWNRVLTLDDQGQARLKLTSEMIGLLQFDASATDASNNVGNATPLNLSVPDPADQQPPTAQILNGSQLTITEPTDIRATINDNSPGDLQWDLTLTDNQTGDTRTLASGTGPRTSAVLHRLDPTMLRNAQYTLRLTARDLALATSDYASVNVEGALKMGNLTLSFTDLQVPLAGTPIVISRSYDTLDAGKVGDFGYGWSLDIETTKIDVQMDPERVPDFSGYKPFRDGDRVIVTLGDGTKHGFTFYGRVSQSLFGIPLYYSPAFQPDPGITSRLIVDSLDLKKFGDDYLDQGTGRLYNPADPTFGGSYELKLRNGTRLVMDAKTGELSSTVDRNNNELKFRYDGIFSDSGKSVRFERDWAGRITAIIDPNNRRITYAYDALGNLTKVTNRLGAETKFTYLDTPKHYLDTVIDPLGRTAFKANYTPDGRVGKLTGASGSQVGLGYDVANRTETMTDPLGNVSRQTKDARGNIVRTVDPAGVVVKRAFDAKDRLLSETQVIGLEDGVGNSETNDITTNNRYNDKGDLIESTDIHGRKTIMTYNEWGVPTSQTDPFGNTTFNSFSNTTGNLVATSDNFANQTSFKYDEDGNVTETRDRNGNVQFSASYTPYGEILQVNPGQGRTAKIRYNDNGDPIARWTIDEAGTQFLTITYFDDERRSTGSVTAKLPAGQTIEQNFETATIPPQF
ncbi:MAG: putative Ig domain-containing protein, partial [Planctomycetota bacterium]